MSSNGVSQGFFISELVQMYMMGTHGNIKILVSIIPDIK